MLIEKGTISSEQFTSEFNKRFSSFAQKAPLLISYVVNPNGVTVFENTSEMEKKELFYHEFDFELPVKENIREIKSCLMKDFYPILTFKSISMEEYSPSELNEMVSSGKISLDNLPIKKQKTTTVNWRIEKIITIRDEIFIRNLNDNKCHRWKMRTPVTIFLKKYREAKGNPEALNALYNFFISKAMYLNEIYDDYDDRVKQGLIDTNDK